LKKKGRLMADLIASHFHMPDMAALSTSLSAFAEDHGLARG
jgi:hypothetical protein